MTGSAPGSAKLLEMTRKLAWRRPSWVFGAHVSHVAVLFLTTFGSGLLVFLTQLILVRLISIAEYGQLVALLAVINLMTPISAYGVGWFWLRAFGEEGWKGFRWLPSSIRLLALTCTLSTIVLVIYTWFKFDESDRLLASALAIPILLGQVFAETTSAGLQLEERFFLLAVWQALTQTGRFVVAVALFAFGVHADVAPIAGYAALGTVMTVMGLLSIRKLSRGDIGLSGHGIPPAASEHAADEPSLLRIVREATPFCRWTVFYSLYFQSVVILLAALVGKPAAAVYNVAFQIISAAYLVPGVIYSKYMFGKVFRWAEHDVARFYAAFHVGVIGMTVLGLAAMVGVMLASPVLVPILFGRAYVASVPVVVALSATIPIRFLQNAYASLYYSKDNMGRNVLYGGITALFCVSANFILLPHFGLTGAVITQAATELLLLGLYMRGVKRFNKEIRLWQSFRVTTFRQALKTLSGAPAG